jgi:type IV pilus assembly protein PilQ
MAAVHVEGVSPGTPRMKMVARASSANAGDQSLEIHFPDADIVEVLEALSQQGNLNILASDSVQGKVSVNLIGVDVEGALEAILKSTRFVARRDGKFIFIGTREDFSAMEQSLDTITTRVYRPNYVTATELQTLIQPMVTQEIGVVSVSSPAEVGIEADESNAGGNAFAGGDVVLVRDYEAVLSQIDQVMEEIDVRPLQVAIEAMILAVKVDDEHSLGVSFELLRNNPNVRYGLGAPLNNLPATLANGGLQYAFIDSNLGAFVEALESFTDTNVIATPRLTVLNKHRAEIQIGKSDGYVSSTITETSTSQSVEFLDTGTLLRLRPFISGDGLIRMEVHPELSSGEVTLKGQFTVPEKEVTQVTTNVMVRDGCTVVIGGLMREQLVNDSSQIPILGSLPWVGPLFRNKQENVERQEILVLITPRIVREPESCLEGSQAACEFQRRQAVSAEKFSPLGKRHVARRYYRLAQEAQAAGDVDRALKYAEMAVHFDPTNNAAIELRSNIWLGIPADPGVSPHPAAEGTMIRPLDPQVPWASDDLEGAADTPFQPAQPIDPGQPGYHKDLPRPGIWE